MNEIDQDTYATERNDKGKKYPQARHKLVCATAAANGSQHDQAIRENAGKHSQCRLRDATTHEVSQNAGGVLTRRLHQCQQGHGEGDSHDRDHRTGQRGQHLACAFRFNTKKPGPLA